MLRRVPLVTCVVLGAACASGTVAQKKPGPAPAPSLSAAPSAAAGSTATIGRGRTRLHPLISGSWVARDALPLSNDATLYVGASGQRWTVRMKPAPTADDPEAKEPVLQGASSMAPEALIAARKTAQGLLLVGESGATYPVKAALDDLSERRLPPEPLRAVAAGKNALLGITRDDRMLRSIDGGASWTKVGLPPSSAVPLLVAASAEAEAMVLAAPGRVLASFDDGATFATIRRADDFVPITASPASDGHVWARSVTVGGKINDGLTGVLSAWSRLSRGPDGAPVVSRVVESPPAFDRPLPTGEDSLGLGDAVRNGTAAWSGLRYLELHPAHDDSGLFHAVSIEQGVVTHLPPIAATNDCDMVGLAADGAFVVAECVRDDTVTLLRSSDGAKTFVADAKLGWGDRMPRHLWVSAKGTVILDGVCAKPGAPSCGDGLFVRPAGEKSFVASKLGPLGAQRRVSALTIGSDGLRVVAATSDEEAGTTELSVSKDGGKTWAHKRLPTVEDFGFNDVTDVSLDEKTGSIVLLANLAPPHRLLTKDEGATWDVKELPIVAEWISLAGARGLATAADAPGRGWETLDQGATWGEVTLPIAAGGGGTLPVACSELGCILGDVAIREGWELASASDVKPPRPSAPANPLAHRPLLECVAAGDEIPLGDATRPEIAPSARYAWATVTESATGEVDVVAWPHGAKAPQRVSLLDAPKVPSAIRRLSSGDGALVVRVAREAPAGKKSVDAEIAWWVPATGKTRRVVLPAAAMPVGKWGSAPAGMATIVPGFGVVARLPLKDELAPLRVLRDDGSVTQVPTPIGFPGVSRLWARRAGARTLYFGPAPDSSLGERDVAFALRGDAGDLSTWTWGLWPRLTDRVRVEVGWASHALVLSWPGTETIAPRAWVLPLDGASATMPEPPEPIALPPAPEVAVAKACAKGKEVPRLELPWVRGERTPLLIKHGKRTQWHATVGTVVQGTTSADLCRVGLLAGTASTANPTEWTVLPADGSTPMLFARSGKTHVLQPLSCAPSTTPLPSSLSYAPGFTR
ncbi:MAG: hypothetical protein HYV09_23295 [Deltaproteobacteria bacterium]|nr:hypothetical protein [Deltaproteobacteria bacterium]